MKVYAKVFATLVQHLSGTVLNAYPEGVRAGFLLEVELPEGSTVADLVAYLGLPKEEVRITFVNGKAQELGYCLSPGDQVGIFPPIGGG